MEDYKKKYETAIKQAKEELKTCGSLDCDAARQIFRFFPELKESEDERIRKEILSYLKSSGAVTNPNWIAWLEKQGEQKLADKIIALRTEYEKGKADAIAEMQKPAWSEEDEENFNTLSKIICDSQASAKIANKLSDWLKALKEKMKGE